MMCLVLQIIHDVLRLVLGQLGAVCYVVILLKDDV